MMHLKRALAFMPGSFLVALSDLEIEREDQSSLVLNADGWLVKFDKPSQVVTHSGKFVASFSSVETIDVEHFINGSLFGWWVLSLTLKAGRKFSIGRSVDGAQVLIAAAHAATVTGKKVRSFERARL